MNLYIDSLFSEGIIAITMSFDFLNWKVILIQAVLLVVIVLVRRE